MTERITRTTTGIRGFIVRIIPTLLLVSALFYGLGSVYARMFLPVFAFEMALFHPEYKIVSYGTEENQIKGNSIYFTFKSVRPIINKAGVPQHNNAEIPMFASVLYIQPIIVFSLLLSWPALSLKERGWGLLISVPLMIAATLIDIPIYFIARIDGAFPAGSLSEQIRIMLNYFFDNGGRQFLALLVALATVGLISIMRIPRVNPKTGSNDPCPCGSGKKYKYCCKNR
jgi:hypothetical protein